jgi:GAF domain
VFEAMLANATTLCEASYGLMYLCEGDALRMAALHGDLPEAFKEQWRSGTLFRPHPDVAPARAVRTRKVVHVADLREDRAYLSGDPLPVAGVEVAGIRTIVVIPMLKENEPVGAISIYRKEVRPFTDKRRPRGSRLGGKFAGRIFLRNARRRWHGRSMELRMHAQPLGDFSSMSVFPDCCHDEVTRRNDMMGQHRKWSRSLMNSARTDRAGMRRDQVSLRSSRLLEASLFATRTVLRNGRWQSGWPFLFLRVRNVHAGHRWLCWHDDDIAALRELWRD